MLKFNVSQMKLLLAGSLFIVLIWSSEANAGENMVKYYGLKKDELKKCWRQNTKETLAYHTRK